MRNITRVYYAKSDKINVIKKLQFLPETKLDRISKYKSEKDKKLSVGVFLLLKKVLKRKLINIDHYNFIYEESGKPILKNCRYHFSLSHSGNYVAVAISKSPVGIDIEEIRNVDLDARRLVFNEEDEKLFNDSENKTDTFFSLWVNKEAKFKMNQTPFKNAKPNDSKIFTVQNKYKLGIATKDKNIKIKKIRI